MKKIIRIGGRAIGEGHPVFIIAEAGVNHNGQLAIAKKLIAVAARAGADAVKFQTFRAEQVVVPNAEMAAYQKRNVGKRMSQQAMLRSLELPEAWYPELIAYAKRLGILFLSTPHGGFESVDFLRKHNIPAFKFGSGDLTNTPLLEYAARFGKPMILSTGMATLAEAKEALRAVRAVGNTKIIMLHATTDYPCPPQEVNLRAIKTLATLGVLTGYSDHTQGISAAIAATVIGARVIEKHFTIDRNMPGPDHRASLPPDELTNMVRALRNIPIMLGDGVKKPQKGEQRMITSVRKSIVTIAPVRKGESFTQKNIGILRPGSGLQPREWKNIIGKKAKRDVALGSLLRAGDY